MWKARFAELEGMYDILGIPFGYYVVPAGEGLRVVDVSLDEPSGGIFELAHVEGDVFRRQRREGDLGEKVLFLRDDQGSVIALLHHAIRHERIDGGRDGSTPTRAHARKSPSHNPEVEGSNPSGPISWL